MACASSLYPITLTRLEGRLAVVVGGGPVAERKVRRLLACGVRIRVVSPEVTDALEEWAGAREIDWLPRTYLPGDLDGAFLTFAATNCRRTNRQVFEESRACGALCNVADRAGEGDFHVPAVGEKDGIVVAVSTAECRPALAVRVRDWVVNNISDVLR